MSAQTDLAKIQTVVAVRPGVTRQALLSTLALHPQIEIKGVAGGSLFTLNLVRQHKPALLVVDSGLLEDEITVLLQKIKREQPHIRCLVLTDTLRQQQTLLAAGADAVILHSAPTERLVEALDNIGL